MNQNLGDDDESPKQRSTGIPLIIREEDDDDEL